MSGGASAATVAAIASAAAAGGSLAYGVYSGQKQQGVQQQQLKNQTTAQQQTIASSLSTQRQGEMAQNAANMKTPDIAGILQRAALAAKGGVGSTMLTGPGGVNTSQLNLGGTKALGS